MRMLFALSLCLVGIMRVDAASGCYGVDCTTIPERETIECPAEDLPATSPGPITIPWERRQKVTFNNTLAEEVTVFWLNPDGREELVQRLSPYETVSQRTHFGHVFRVRSLSGRTLVQHKVGLTAIYNDAQLAELSVPTLKLRGSGNEEGAEVRVQQYSPPRNAFTEGWINRAKFPIKMFWYNEKGVRGPETLAVLEPNQCSCECTYSGHEFRSFVNDGRYVATRIADTHIHMPICPEMASFREQADLFVFDRERVSFRNPLVSNCTRDFPSSIVTGELRKGMF